MPYSQIVSDTAVYTPCSIWPEYSNIHCLCKRLTCLPHYTHKWICFAVEYGDLPSSHTDVMCTGCINCLFNGHSCLSHHALLSLAQMVNDHISLQPQQHPKPHSQHSPCSTEGIVHWPKNGIAVFYLCGFGICGFSLGARFTVMGLHHLLWWSLRDCRNVYMYVWYIRQE